MVFIINFNVLKVYDKETERFVKRIVKIEIYIIFNFCMISGLFYVKIFMRLSTSDKACS